MVALPKKDGGQIETQSVNTLLKLIYYLLLLACLSAPLVLLCLAGSAFDWLSDTLTCYLLAGMTCFYLCVLALIHRNNPALFFFTIFCFLFFDFSFRLLLLAWEAMPGAHKMALAWADVMPVMTVRFILVAVILVTYHLRPKLNRFIYALSVFLLASISFYVTAVHIPSLLQEPLLSYRIDIVDLPYLRVSGCSDETALLLTSLPQRDIVTPSHPRLIRKEREDILFDAWSPTADILGRQCCGNDDEYSFVVHESPGRAEVAQLRFVRYVGAEITHDLVYECPMNLVPTRWANCLSPDGALVALNNGALVCFDTGAASCVFPDMPHETTHHFVEWTNSEDGWVLYYQPEGQQVCFVNPAANQVAATHRLKIGGPDIFSLTLSPDGRCLLYARAWSNYFFCEEVGGDDVKRFRLPFAKSYMDYCPPFWMDNTCFMYVSRSLALYAVDVNARRMQPASQLLESVSWASYEPATRRVLWTTAYGESTGIHSRTVQ